MSKSCQDQYNIIACLWIPPVTCSHDIASHVTSLALRRTFVIEWPGCLFYSIISSFLSFLLCAREALTAIRRERESLKLSQAPTCILLFIHSEDKASNSAVTHTLARLLNLLSLHNQSETDSRFDASDVSTDTQVGLAPVYSKILNNILTSLQTSWKYLFLINVSMLITISTFQNTWSHSADIENWWLGKIYTSSTPLILWFSDLVGKSYKQFANYPIFILRVVAISYLFPLNDSN